MSVTIYRHVDVFHALIVSYVRMHIAKDTQLYVNMNADQLSFVDCVLFVCDDILCYSCVGFSAVRVEGCSRIPAAVAVLHNDLGNHDRILVVVSPLMLCFTSYSNLIIYRTSWAPGKRMETQGNSEKIISNHLG